ncbi:hypothetical protein CF65_00748 [Aggregatibacter actinomycetemcomitans HK1651]|nr:hypothetical protein CF65_00748 [Aggregatibacter actinomycetemcomitans HK1651]
MFNTLETVATDTPAWLATSRIVTMEYLYYVVKIRQIIILNFSF